MVRLGFMDKMGSFNAYAYIADFALIVEIKLFNEKKLEMCLVYINSAKLQILNPIQAHLWLLELITSAVNKTCCR
jgi:hypothetical protein